MQVSGSTSMAQWSSGLKHLTNDIGTFSDDSLIMIQNYFPQTQVETHIVDVLKQLSQQLQKGSNPPVYASFKTIKTKLVKLLKERSSFIEQGVTTANDLWASQAARVDRATAESLMKASASFQDLRFMIEEVCQCHLEEAKKLALEDIEKFRSKLTTHVNTLNLDHSQKRNLIELLNLDLNELTKATKLLDFVKAKEVISHMEKPLAKP